MSESLNNLLYQFVQIKSTDYLKTSMLLPASALFINMFVGGAKGDKVTGNKRYKMQVNISFLFTEVV